MSQPDPLAAVKTLLLADVAVAARVADRIGYEVPESENTQMSRACVVLRPAGGPGRPGAWQQFGKQRLDVVCYGATLHESWLVYLDVAAVLQAIERDLVDGVLLHSAECTSKGQNARDPFTQWPTCYSTWLLLAATVAAA